MRVPRRYVDAFTDSVNFLSADMRKRLGDALEMVDMSDIAAARDAVIGIMTTFCGAYTDMAAVLGAEFYDGLREMALGSALGAVAESGWEPEAEDKAVRALIQGVVDGGTKAEFVESLLDRADSEVRRSANESVARNARRDKAKVGYARVPSGIETCKWCIMIASKGPSFRSMEIASHSHANCDCRVVPDFGDGIQGYDPDYYYDVYKHPENHPEYREARNARRRELYDRKKAITLANASSRPRVNSIGAVYSEIYKARDEEVSRANLENIKQTQLVHIAGTRQSVQAARDRGIEPSCFTIGIEEIRLLIKKHAGHGEPDNLYGYAWSRKEICTSDHIVGYVINNNGDKIPTRCFKIHYSNDGVHAVPRYDIGGEPDDV